MTSEILPPTADAPTSVGRAPGRTQARYHAPVGPYASLVNGTSALGQERMTALRPKRTAPLREPVGPELGPF